jgi:hypothetical protein
VSIRTTGFKVKPRNTKQVRKVASTLHEVFSLNTNESIDVISLIDIDIPKKLEGFHYEVVPDKEMGNYAGLYYPAEMKMELKESVYDGACSGNGQDKFTIAHEIGHMILHSDEVALAKTTSDSKPRIFEDSEWQADQFAAELLMPFNEVVSLNSPEEIQEKFKVSAQAARVRFEKVRKEKQSA